MQRRLFHRVTCCMPAEFTHQGITYRGRVENISLRGALLGSDDCVMIPPGDECRLSIEVGQQRVVLTAQVVHAFFSMVGVRFIAFEDDGESRLFRLMQRITQEPETLRMEWEQILGHERQD